MIHDPTRMSVRAMLAVIEVLLFTSERSEYATRTAMNLVYRALRAPVLRYTKEWTYSDADTLSTVAEFWDFFWQNQEIDRYQRRKHGSFLNWFRDYLDIWLVSFASVA